MPDKFKYFIPSIADIIFCVLFLVLSLAMSSKLLLDCDTGYHIITGDFILRTFSIPQHDLFSFITPPPHFVAFEWLSEVIMSAIHHSSGLTGIVIFFSFLIALTFYLLFKILRTQDCNIFIAVFITLLVITASSIHWLARPHIFSLLLIVIWYHTLDLYQYKEKNYLYLLPFIMLLWVNLHGAFVLGFFLSGVYFLGNLIKAYFSEAAERKIYATKARVLFIVLVFTLLTSLLNPNGFKGSFYPLEALTNKFMIDHIGEFLSPNFHDVGMLPFEILLMFTIFILAISRKRLNIIETFLLILFTNMALLSIRNIPLFTIIMAPILSRQCIQLLNEHHGKLSYFLRNKDTNISMIDRSTRGYLWLLMPMIFVSGVAYAGCLDYRFDEKIKPVAAVEFLKKEHIKGNMYNGYEFGDYIIYNAYPQYKVFIDGRADMYGAEWFKEYYRINKLRTGWEEILDKYDINFIIFDNDSYLSKFLLEKKEWQLIYSDKVANIFLRNTPDNQLILNKYSNVTPFIIDDKDDSL